jgi:uncharacterized membrane protein YtjA (UPF0391 family)
MPRYSLMFRYSVGFLFIVAVSGFIAYSGIAIRAASTAEAIFFISLPFFVVTGLLGLLSYKKKVMDKTEEPDALPTHEES